MEEPSCISCKTAQTADLRLSRCPICFRLVCNDCVVMRGGRPFCSLHCADFYFFGDEEL